MALGADVHLVVRPSTHLTRIEGVVDRLTLHTSDLTDAASVASTVAAVGPRTVFHIAATGAYGGDHAALFRDNVLATFHVLQAASTLAGCRVIHTASSLEPGPRLVPIREDDPFAPVVPYGAAKAAATLLAQQAAARGQRVVMLRPFAIYGPGEPDTRLIPTAIRAALTGRPLPLTAHTATRDFVFVEDVVDAYIAAAATEDIDGELINVATGQATSNADVVQLVARIVGRPIAISADPYPPKSTDTPLWCADVSKARRVLGWQAAHTLEQGLAATVAHHTARATS